MGQMLHEPGRWRSRLWWLRIVARGHGGCILKAEPMGFAHILTVKCEKNTSGKSPRTSLGLSPGRMKVPCSCLLRVGRITWLFQPIGNQCHCGTGPLVLTMIATLPSAITIRKLKKKKRFITSGPGNYIVCLGPQSEVTGREREEKRERIHRQARGEGWRPRVS